MKTELPLAILLLAAGFAIWTWKNGDHSPSQSPLLPQSEKSLQVATQFASQASPVNAQAFSAEGIFLETIQQLRQSPPLQAEIALAIEMFHESFSMTGRYTQAGQGTPMARFDIAVGEGELTVTQAFDGRFYYIVETANDFRSFKYADLIEITRLEPPTVATIPAIQGWFGTGGFVPFLEQLSGSFDFQIVNEANSRAKEGPGRMETVKVRGTWKRETLHQLLRDQIDPQWLDEPIHWERFPQQLPHYVEVTFAQEGDLPYFPYQIVFFKEQREGRGGESGRRAMFAINVRSLAIVEPFAADWFRISAEGYAPEDVTEDYLNRIKMFFYQPIIK